VARVILLNPATDEPVRSPLLSFCYLASALRHAGHEVAIIDGSAPAAPRREIVDRALDFRPDLVGIHAKTLYVQDAYALARAIRLRSDVPMACGGPHPTVAPLEPLRHGFTFSVLGEAEKTLPELADALDGRRAFDSVRSLAFLQDGTARLTASRGFELDLDGLPSPLDALDLFDPAWYGAAATMPPSGLLSSRGCPAACTFCSNNVTGRRFRYRSAALVAGEIDALYARTGVTAFSFFDDSFAVGRRRVFELCDALSKTAARVHWTCTAHPAHLDGEVLRAMKAAGCAGVDIGMESGDPEMLLRIGKGVDRDRVLRVLDEARALGLHCMLNLMFGWPDETLAELETTIRFMEEAAPLAAAFNARGVLVPYPGTEIYQKHHARFGFTEWWLREPIRYAPFPARWSRGEVERAYADDAALERNFFRHPPPALALIREGLAKKATLTFGKLIGPSEPALPAAGAR